MVFWNDPRSARRFTSSPLPRPSFSSTFQPFNLLTFKRVYTEPRSVCRHPVVADYLMRIVILPALLAPSFEGSAVEGSQRSEPRDLSSYLPAFKRFLNKSFPCHTSAISPVTPLFATHPKTPSRKSFACHRSETPPGSLSLVFIQRSTFQPSNVQRSNVLFSSLATSVANLHLYFHQLPRRSSRNPFFFRSCIVAGSVGSPHQAGVKVLLEARPQVIVAEQIAAVRPILRLELKSLYCRFLTSLLRYLLASSTGESEGGMSAPTESRRPRGFWQAYSGFTAVLQLAGTFWRTDKLLALARANLSKISSELLSRRCCKPARLTRRNHAVVLAAPKDNAVRLPKDEMANCRFFSELRAAGRMPFCFRHGNLFFIGTAAPVGFEQKIGEFLGGAIKNIPAPSDLKVRPGRYHSEPEASSPRATFCSSLGFDRQWESRDDGFHPGPTLAFALLTS